MQAQPGVTPPSEVSALPPVTAHMRPGSQHRVRHRAGEAVQLMVFSAVASGLLALALTVLTTWATRTATAGH